MCCWVVCRVDGWGPYFLIFFGFLGDLSMNVWMNRWMEGWVGGWRKRGSEEMDEERERQWEKGRLEIGKGGNTYEGN